MQPPSECISDRSGTKRLPERSVRLGAGRGPGEKNKPFIKVRATNLNPGKNIAHRVIRLTRAALERIIRLGPDIVILSSGGRNNALKAAHQIRRVLVRARLLLLNLQVSERGNRPVFDLGARDPKASSTPKQQRPPGRKAGPQGDPNLPDRVAKMVLAGLGASGVSAPRADGGDPLTPREREVLYLLATGKSSKEAAAALGLSVKTAETHRANIMRKLSLHSVSQLVLYAVRRKLVQA